MANRIFSINGFSLSFLTLLLFILWGCNKKDDEVVVPVLKNKISGTINAVAGETVAGTFVIACFNNDCEDTKTKFVQLTQGLASAPFEITDLDEGKYSIIAWKDFNANNEVDAGDRIDFLSSNGQDPELISPGKEGINLQLKIIPGQNGNSGGAGNISGRISALSGQNLKGTYVIACQWDGTECVESTSQVVEVQSNGTYTFSGLAPEFYFIIAWKDTNSNGDIDEGDFYGLYVKDGSIGSVRPPSQDINVTISVLSLQDNPGGGNGGSVPANLAGDWIRGTAGAVDFYNPSTGGWAAPSGTGMYLKLHSDGSFELSTVVQVTNYNCTTQVTTFYRGSAIFNGNNITLEPTYTRQKFNSNCFSQHNSDNVVPNSPLPFTWHLETNEKGEQELVLIWPNGVESSFRRP